MKFNYRIRIVILIVSICLISLGCVKTPSPETILSQYLDASLHGLHEEAYKYVSSRDKAFKSKDEYLTESKNDLMPVEAFSSKISYVIESISTSEDKATAIVSITMPDFGGIFLDVMGAALQSVFSGENDDKFAKKLAEKYKDKEVPLTTKKETFTLIKEVDGWKVFLDWETQKLKAEREKKIKGLLAEAKNLKKQKKLHGALEKYNEILELDSEVIDAKRGIKETETAIKDFEEKQKAFKEKQEYIKNVTLKNFKVSEGQRYSFSDPEQAIFGTIVNKGNRTLREVEITVYFLDKDGVVIGEKNYYPVLVTKFSFGDDNKPLNPNYVKDFGYSVKDYAPSAWAGKVKGEITDIEFDDSTN